ncbi:hypothetical protein B296_00003310 [Ensete ventricosum]|uniref:Uncharacterized protein n=1 Tax=Ensete ventricosum TaxID=4639 RepID=A0A427AZ01_ENSVE|nr:hypothetical protein B296_00003310 [Ensete ventricosum]
MELLLNPISKEVIRLWGEDVIIGYGREGLVGREQMAPSLQLFALFLLAVLVVGSEAHDVRPSEHGLAHEKDPGPASPAMVAFFRGRPEVALPEAQNVSEPAWKLAPPRPQNRDGPSAVLLAAGVACGIVGSALLAAAAVAFVVHARRSGFGLRPGRAFSPARRSGPEVRLGSA